MRDFQQYSGTDITETPSFQLLTGKQDPESLLIINCELRFCASYRTSLTQFVVHGNAGTLAQGWRTDTYRALGSAASDRIHVLTFDYRGFGESTGSPSEDGLVIDGIAVVDWALYVAKIPPQRIVLVGQSLGTAVASAVAEYFSTNREVDFAGVVLVAAFTDLPSLVLKYAIKGVIPILSPLRTYPRLQRWFTRQVVDTWQTEARLTNLVQTSKHLNLAMIHAKNDIEISWRNTEHLFQAVANATSSSGMAIADIDSVKNHVDLGMGGWQNTWTTESSTGALKRIKEIIVPYGGECSCYYMHCSYLF